MTIVRTNPDLLRSRVSQRVTLRRAGRGLVMMGGFAIALISAFVTRVAVADGGVGPGAATTQTTPTASSSNGAAESDIIAPDPPEIRGLTVEELVGVSLPLELTFVNSEGTVVRLGDYFKTEDGKGGTAAAFGGVGRPTVLMLVYYRCPVVCDVLMAKMTQTFDELDFSLGKDYNALFISIDETEGPASSKAAKEKYAGSYRMNAPESVRAAALAGWQFHTSDGDSVGKLANTVGYQYRKLSNGEYSHPVVAFVITPDGKLSRYLYGFKQESRDLKLALMEASEGKLVRTIGDRLLAFCYMYDPTRGGYSLQAIRVMQVGGIVSIVGMVLLIGVLLLGERLRKRAALSGGSFQTTSAGAASALLLKEGNS